MTNYCHYKLIVLTLLLSCVFALAHQETRINLNTATRRQLETISGIGPGTAARIILERNRRGGFRKVEDLLKIQGIGRKTLVRLKKKLYIPEPPEQKENSND